MRDIILARQIDIQLMSRIYKEQFQINKKK